MPVMTSLPGSLPPPQSLALAIIAAPHSAARAPGLYAAPGIRDALRRIDAALVFCPATGDRLVSSASPPPAASPPLAASPSPVAPPAAPSTAVSGRNAEGRQLPVRPDLAEYLYNGGCWGVESQQAPEAVFYRIIDGASGLRTSLESAREEIDEKAQTVRASLRSLEPLDRLLSTLLERVYFMEGIARVGVARSMAAAGQSQYCFQAMEAATDDLGRAAAERQRYSGAEGWMPVLMPWSEIEEIHAKVFMTWEAARTADDTASIRDLTVSALLCTAEEAAAKKPENRSWTARHVFRWLTSQSPPPPR